MAKENVKDDDDALGLSGPTSVSQDFANSMHNSASESVESVPLDQADTVSVGTEGSREAPQAAAPLTTGGAELEQDQTAAAEANAWKNILAEAGFEDIDTMDTAAQRSVDAIRQRDEQIETLANQVRWYNSNQGQAYQQQPAPAPAAPADPELGAIENITKGWQDIPLHVVQEWLDPDTGSIRDDAPPSIRQNIEQFAQKRHEWSQLVADPRQFVAAIDERVQKMIDAQLETGFSERQRQYQDQTAEERFLDDNAFWMYAKDPATGRPVVDPVTGYQMFSRQGQEFQRLFEHTEQMGVQSIADRIAIAKAFYDQTNAAQTAQPAVRREDQQGIVEQQRQAMLGRTNTTRPAQTAVNNVSPGLGQTQAGEQSRSIGEAFLQELVRS